MTDEEFYARVVDELQSTGPLPGLWAKAFAEAEGVESKAKAIYLKSRASQLVNAEIEAKRAAGIEDRHRRNALHEQKEGERRAKANAEGSTPIHYVLWALVIFFVLLGAFRALSG